MESRGPQHDVSSHQYTALDDPISLERDENYLTRPTVYSRNLADDQLPEEPHVCLKNKAENIAGYHNEVNTKIQQAFKLLTFRIDCCLIQFWSTCSVGKNELLKTADQPFALGICDGGLCNYRKESEHKCFHVDDNYEEVHELIPVVRVYKHRMPGWTSDVTNCYLKYQPLQVCAIRLNLHGYLVLPVFDSSTKSCVGVLEFITSSIYLDCAYEVQQIHQALKAVNLTSPQAFDTPTSYVDYNNTQHEQDQIFSILKDVCKAHKLPFAQTWTVSPRTSFVATGRNIAMTCDSFNSCCIGKTCMSTTALPYYVHDLSLWPFREVCKGHHLLESRGVVGRALSSHGSCFCADVAKLDEDEYSLVHNARMSGLTSCFAIYLHSIQHADSYVLEFFLPVNMKEGADLHNLVQKVKMHLKLTSFEFGDLTSTEVIGMQTEISQLSSEMQLDSKELLTVGETNANIDSINAQCQSDFSNVDKKNWIKLYANDVTSYEYDVFTKQRRKHKMDSVTREAIQQNFGKPIEEASKALGGFSKLLADQNIIDPQIIKEKITHALSNLSFRDPHVLVQFWSPVTVRKRCLLTTLDQPFGLGVFDEALYLYRLESEQRMFVVDGEHREELGPPGRVYRQKLPEWSLGVHNSPTRQSSNHGYINLPVLEPDSGCCVGVIEIITSSTYVDYAFEVHEVSRALKEENLKSPNVFENPSLYIQIENARRPSELDEIFQALKSICDIQNIPLAQTWALSGFSSVVASSGNLEPSCSSFNRNCIGKTCMSTYDLPFYVPDLSMWDFHEACRERHLHKPQGVVGKSMSSCGLCFCEDITKLDEDIYPLSSHARVNRITSCLAIYMKGMESDVEYVIEFVLPPHHANEADLQSLVLTVKQQIKNVSSVKLCNLSSLQVIGGDPLNWNFESPPSPITILPENEEVLPEPGNQLLLVENELIDVNDVPLSKDESEVAYVEHMEDDNLEIKLIDNAAAGTSQSVVPCLNVGIEDTDINEGKPERKNFDDKFNKPKRKRKRAERSIGVEEISKHYGKPMEEAAANLLVSRSTLKRICRGFGISRWPYKNDKSGSILKSNQTDIVIHASERATTPDLGTSIEPLGPSNIYVPISLTEHGNQSSILVRHKEEQTNLPDGSAQPKTTIGEQYIKIASAANIVKNFPTKSTHKENTENTSAANTVKTLTIKATYKENTVKFPFNLSDGLVKLEELVATRFQLSPGNFRLKYADADSDLILIACDSDLMGSVGDSRQPGHQTLIRILVLPVVNPDTN